MLQSSSLLPLERLAEQGVLKLPGEKWAANAPPAASSDAVTTETPGPHVRESSRRKKNRESASRYRALKKVAVPRSLSQAERQQGILPFLPSLEFIMQGNCMKYSLRAVAGSLSVGSSHTAVKVQQTCTAVFHLQVACFCLAALALPSTVLQRLLCFWPGGTA